MADNPIMGAMGATFRIVIMGATFTIAPLSWVHVSRSGDAEGDALDYLRHRRATTTGRSASPATANPVKDGKLCTSPNPAVCKASCSSSSV